MSVVIFWDEGFPFHDTAPLSRQSLEAAFPAGVEARFVSAAELPEALQTANLLVLPYGSAFPKSAWTAFRAYLARGGNWVNLGGAPLTRPVRWESGEWRVEGAQTAYGKALGINHCIPIDLPEEAGLRCPPLDVDLETHFHLFRPQRAWSLQVKFTTTKDFPDEGGSSGPREGLLRPLVLSEVDGRVLAAPIIAIDRLLGDGAGGRWVLAACKGSAPLPPDLIGRLCDYAVRPRAHLLVRPSFACYYPGEMAEITVTAHASEPADLRINLRVYSRDTQKEVYAHLFRASCGAGPAVVQTSPFPAKDPGLYIVRAQVEVEGHSKPIGYAESGFWVYDKRLITSGKPLTTDRDYFLRDGQPYPVTGTTYMAGDVHRKFLFEPNPAVWDTDFAAMSAAGVNMVRTGIWTAWKRVMLDPGAVDEGVLRAFTAFLLTARRYDIPIIFTFFAFLPEAWGGENPYLDPRAVAAQSALVAAFARRFAHVKDLMWDFINEPSFSSPERVWSTRPNYDRFERAAWTEWLAAQGVSEDEWRERWRLTPDDPLDLPALTDFDDKYIFQGTHPLRVLDYRRFAQEKFAEWTEQMAQVVRENGSPEQLVTVGQDEGGTRDRPNPWFHSHTVDFTSNHSWWQNDDLLWDSLITKTPDKPNLIEETGIMFVERPDGCALRSPEEARNLLERKMALAFAGGCAGFIQWLWNTNVTMDSDNEVGIGFLRADGSEKPELEAFRGIARFFAANAHLMVGRKPEAAVVVISHSNMFSVRNLADQATRRAVRTLEYGQGIPCRMVAEHRAEEAGDAKLIVLPSARVLTESCWQTLVKKAEAGATVLVTGVIEEDEYWRPVERLGVIGLKTHAASVRQSERARFGDRPMSYAMDFTGDSIQKLDKAVLEDGSLPRVKRMEVGAGAIHYCPLPVELALGHSAWSYYDHAAQAAFDRKKFRWQHLAPGLLVRRVEFERHTLFLLVNESATDYPSEVFPRDDRPSARKLTIPSQMPAGLRVAGARIGIAFVERGTLEVTAKYEPPVGRTVQS